AAPGRRSLSLPARHSLLRCRSSPSSNPRRKRPSAMPTVAGIDLAAGRGVTAVAVLAVNDVPSDGSVRPRFDHPYHQAVQSDTEILEAVARALPLVVGIDAPLTLPTVVADALRASFHAPQAKHAWPIEVGSPYTRAAERDPLWGQIGLRPLPVSFLSG